MCDLAHIIQKGKHCNSNGTLIVLVYGSIALYIGYIYSSGIHKDIHTYLHACSGLLVISGPCNFDPNAHAYVSTFIQCNVVAH